MTFCHLAHFHLLSIFGLREPFLLRAEPRSVTTGEHIRHLESGKGPEILRSAQNDRQPFSLCSSVFIRGFKTQRTLILSRPVQRNGDNDQRAVDDVLIEWVHVEQDQPVGNHSDHDRADDRTQQRAFPAR